MWCTAFYLGKDDERIRGLVLNLNDFEGGIFPSLEYVGKAIQKFQRVRKASYCLC